MAHQTTSFIHWSLILDSYHVRLSPDIKHYLTWLDLVVGCYESLHLLSILQVCCDPPHSSIQFMALFAGSFSTYWQILTASLGELEERPPRGWRLKTTQKVLKSMNLSLNEVNWCGSESSTLENYVYIWHYALIVVHARNEWMNDRVVLKSGITVLILQ